MNWRDRLEKIKERAESSKHPAYGGLTTTEELLLVLAEQNLESLEKPLDLLQPE